MNKAPEQNKNIKRDIIFANVGFILLGLLMVIMQGTANNVICIIGGALMAAGGLFKLYMYFSAKDHTPFSSFGLMPGITLIIFAVLLISSPHIIADTLITVLAIMLIISAVMKIQYTVDFLRLKDKRWHTPILGAVFSITVSCLVLFEVFTEPAVWSILGVALLISGAWDIASVVMLSNPAKAKKSKRRSQD